MSKHDVDNSMKLSKFHAATLNVGDFQVLQIAIQLSYGLSATLKSIWSMVAGRISITIHIFARPMCQKSLNPNKDSCCKHDATKRKRNGH